MDESLSGPERKARARLAIEQWDGEDYHVLMTLLSQKLDVNLFQVHYMIMRLIIGMYVKNKHTGDVGRIYSVSKYDDVYSWNYELIIDRGRITRTTISGKEMFEHWDVIDEASHRV